MKKQYKTLILIQISIIIFLVICFLFLKSEYISLVPKCIFKEKFGILCPACNGTSFAIQIANLNFIGAFRTHPLFFILLIYLVLLDITYIINVVFKKNINIFKWWYAVIWAIILVIYTILRNII